MSRFFKTPLLLSPGDYQSVYDISKAYHHLRLHHDLYQLVGFYVEDINGKERFYHYVVVVFGLAPAGQLLSRVMRPILKALADRGVRNTMYVDDSRTVAGSKSRADKDYEITLYLFKGAGFTVAEEKSDPIGPSSQRKVYLGFLIDTLNMTVEVPAAKLTRIIDLLKAFLTSSQR
jgi:hypothetical protein